ncbi:hypothetical protein DFH11DRAFT_74317 [Phellopilus nigrolimitatus]|nr:hypothetical protein DFH11DRAFT_74317 [Phellopilus nigrolimitatus]
MSASTSAKQNGAAGCAKQNGDADADADLEALLAVSVAYLRQARDLVADSLVEDAQLVFASRYIPGSTIGKHLRHARDHFALLLDSVEGEPGAPAPAPAPARTLDYDARRRDVPMEGSRAAARAALEECAARLQRVAPCVRRGAPLALHARTPHPQTFETTFGRELWFCALHAVHHWAMVRVIAGELGIQLDDSFGVAPSTILHRGSEAPLAEPKV